MEIYGKNVRVFRDRGIDQEVTYGDSVVSFRGQAGTFISVSKPPVPGKSGQVHVKAADGHDYWNYPQVWGLRLEVED